MGNPINLNNGKTAAEYADRAAKATKRTAERAKRLGEARVRQPRPSRAMPRLDASEHAALDLASALGYPTGLNPRGGYVHRAFVLEVDDDAPDA